MLYNKPNFLYRYCITEGKMAENLPKAPQKRGANELDVFPPLPPSNEKEDMNSFQPENPDKKQRVSNPDEKNNNKPESAIVEMKSDKGIESNPDKAAVVEMESDTDAIIERLYHYDNNDTLVFNENFGSLGFSHNLNRIHGFIDCVHDQFDPQRKNIFFSSNTDEEIRIKQLIWKYFIGKGDSFTTKESKEYKVGTGIHTLAHALEIDETAIDTHIKLRLSDGQDYDNNNTKKYFKCIDWGNNNNNNNTGSLSPLTVYKFKNYLSQDSKSEGQKLRDKYGDGHTAITNYILDCGSRNFHDGVVGKKSNENKGISFFSGILDSSTANDVVPLEQNKLDKIKFEIPYLYLPNSNHILYVHCEFKENDTKVLKLKFKINKGEYTPTIEVNSKNVPTLPDVSDFLAGKLGCLQMLKRAFIGTNPCNHYLPTVEQLYRVIQELHEQQQQQDIDESKEDFQNMFMIAFKHMGDKVRLIDAIIANNELSGKCHTATIDTFSNRYAVLGNLHTIMPMKIGKYLYVNNYHNITQADLEKIEEENQKRESLIFQAQKAQFEMLEGEKDNLENTIRILKLLSTCLQIFQRKKQLKQPRNRRMSCLAIQYWDVNIDDNNPTEQVHKAFLNGSYDVNDMESIETITTIINAMADFNVEHIITPLNYLFNREATNLFDREAIVLSQEQKTLLNNLLNLHRMYTQFNVCNIDFKNDVETIQTKNSKKLNLIILVSIISKSKYDISLPIIQNGGEPENNDEPEDYKKTLQEIYKELKVEEELETYRIKIVEDPNTNRTVEDPNTNRTDTNYKYFTNNNFTMIVPTNVFNLFKTQHSLDISRRKLYRYLELDLLGDNDSLNEMLNISRHFKKHFTNDFKNRLLSDKEIERIPSVLNKKNKINLTKFMTHFDEGNTSGATDNNDDSSDEEMVQPGGKRRNTTRKRRRRVTRRKGPIIPKKKKKKRHTRKGKR